MSDRVKVILKKPEVKSNNITSKAQRSNYSQPISSISSPIAQILFLQRTIGNQAVQRLLKSGIIQAKLKIGKPNDIYEQEADRVAEQVMRMPEDLGVRVQGVGDSEKNESIQTKPARCPECEEEEELIQPKLKITPLVQRQVEEEDEEVLQTKEDSGYAPEVSQDIKSRINSIRGGGQPLPKSVGDYFEPRFGYDFSQVRVHIDNESVQLNRKLNAEAFTLGRDIYFGVGRYSPYTSSGRKILAHELTHVVQQNQHIAPEIIQCQCSDPDFCTPYATTAEAFSAEVWLRNYFLPAMQAMFGTEVHDLWDSFLSRAPGASLARRVFDTPGNPIEDSFATSSAVEDDQEAVLDLVVSRLSRFPGGRLSPHVYTVVSLTNFLSASEMNNRPIDFSNPLSKAGNIAGGIGSSAAGPDFRKIARANVALEKVPLFGNSGYINFELIPHYEVYDAIDFCPGQCGSPAEQVFTIPLSRLEASGRAFDVPYVVKFQPEPETKMKFYSSLPL